MRNYGYIAFICDCALWVLTIVLVVLKLGQVIDWPWWWILAPMWIYLALDLLSIIIVYIVWYFIRHKRHK